MNKKCAGYVRVSSKRQVEGMSLTTQRQQISDYAASTGWELSEIYADEGISGAKKDRPALLKLLHDAQQGKFNLVIIKDLSRFGRNVRDLLNNVDELSQYNVQLVSIKESLDFSTRLGKLMLQMISAIAEFEREILLERTLENRIAIASDGGYAGGRLPFARSYNKKTGEYSIKEREASMIRKAAEEYLTGRSLKQIAHELPICYQTLINVFRNQSGSKWVVKFKGQEPIVHDIPAILDDETIGRISERLRFNQKNNRSDIKSYVLSGFLRCYECGCALSGQLQVNRYGTAFRYYRHPGGRYAKCRAMNTIPAEQIEGAVFRTIFENVHDEFAFETAIKDSLPDEGLIKSLQSRIDQGELELSRINLDLEKLVEAFLQGTLSKETIQSKEKALLETRNKVQMQVAEALAKLKTLPDVQQVKQDAEHIRIQLEQYFQSPEYMHSMTFDDKKRILHWLFDGGDHEGTPYGIYISKKGDGMFDYFMYGRLTGLRTLRGKEIDYIEHVKQELVKEILTPCSTYLILTL